MKIEEDIEKKEVDVNNMNILKSDENKKNVLLLTGVHGDELTPIYTVIKHKDELINKSLTAGKPTDQELLYNMRCQIELAEYMAGLVVETLEVQMKQAGSKIEEGG